MINSTAPLQLHCHPLLAITAGFRHYVTTPQLTVAQRKNERNSYVKFRMRRNAILVRH